MRPRPIRPVPPIRPPGPPRPGARRGPLGWALGALVAVGTAWLFQLHLWMLWGRLSDLTISQPGVALRWLAAAALVGVAWRQSRRGYSLLRGHRALVLWALAFLLHAGSTPTSTHPLPLSAQPPAAVHLLWLVPFGIAGELDGLALRFLARLRRRLRTSRELRLGALVAELVASLDSAQAPDLSVPRAPPSVSAALVLT